MMLHDRGELRTDVRPLRLTVTYHAPCQQQAHGVGKRLIDGQADGDVATLRAHDLSVACAQLAADDLARRLR